ncbi:zf-HC2 domain-containing protein [Streptomyces sp. NBC_00963]|uniref:zf-HC2 domain-containing protein n=1 Tax=Streptomyces sp. NBC_00963 TaxID=2903697 RepID=UPI00386D5C88|nr:zf-HC2 domain-containing protein [Streptomyces sp. NBC_00963]
MSSEDTSPYAWHVGRPLAARYASGEAAEKDAWSLEKHVEACRPCAARVSAAVRASAAGPTLAEVRAAVLGQARASRAAGGRPGTARSTPHGSWRARGRHAARALWAAGPALRGPWAVAVVLVVLGAAGLAHWAGLTGARALLLALAPVAPVAGVALSHGRHADPMHEIVTSTPSGGLRLLLIRTTAVLTAGVPVLTGAEALLPAGDGVPGAATWLLPGLALTLGSLALGSYVGCRTAATVLGTGWACAVLLPVAAAGPPGATYLFGALSEQLSHIVSGSSAQSGWAVAATLCAGLLALRRHSFDRMEKA